MSRRSGTLVEHFSVDMLPRHMFSPSRSPGRSPGCPSRGRFRALRKAAHSCGRPRAAASLARHLHTGPRFGFAPPLVGSCMAPPQLIPAPADEASCNGPVAISPAIKDVGNAASGSMTGPWPRCTRSWLNPWQMPSNPALSGPNLADSRANLGRCQLWRIVPTIRPT